MNMTVSPSEIAEYLEKEFGRKQAQEQVKAQLICTKHAKSVYVWNQVADILGVERKEMSNA